MSYLRINQQSKSKKLMAIIETYNRLVRASDHYRQHGMYLEGESAMKLNRPKILELTDLAQGKTSKNNERQKRKPFFVTINTIDSQQIFLGVFVEAFDILKLNKKIVVSRILNCLGLDAAKEFSLVSLEQLVAFHRILIHRDSAISETIKFLEKFFKEKNTELEKEEFKRVLKVLTSQPEEKKGEFKKTLYDHFLDKFEEHGVVDLIEDHVNFKKFKFLFMQNYVNIYDIIDLICGIRP